MILYLLLTAASFGILDTGATPATVCIKTTIKANGHTTDSSVEVTSGNKASDRYALQLVRGFSVARERGKDYEQKTGFALVEIYGSGALGMSLIDHKGELFENCSVQTSGSGT